MEKQNSSQLELFSGADDYVNAEPKTKQGLSLFKIRGYEKTVLIIIGFIIVSLFSFSLGVEKGKKIAASAMTLERASLPAPSQPVASVIEQREGAPTNNPASYPDRPEVLVKKEKEKVKNIKPGYTIQVASYKTKTFAQKEAEFLKKKGFLPLFLTKGSYTVLCVGNFVSRNAAECVLLELKKQKRYGDCMIRRL